MTQEIMFLNAQVNKSKNDKEYGLISCVMNGQATKIFTTKDIAQPLMQVPPLTKKNMEFELGTNFDSSIRVEIKAIR